ncbi:MULTISPECIES: hypothetical protein [Mesorhizobium]|uniref:hypothetical protein n=1 Tax=Mesorhizobium sp. TaxID=1871066 RepID=UPI000494B714|nr:MULTISPECIES: hypothetical protein [Mesorhizobium]RWB26981.1 MAG: hypothetical protein EOQ43_28815 [Mesorhizobium sp.]RWE65474.1 MAG: hypothetical protein EOS62_24840 [Mesorhizobium sp.]RWH69650.1 MAG: hypothetical protein EOQ85_32360 [Mesorhizobium sp.]RWH83885.1 MAG: hypothetical protein EOQ87_32015 [Mesorhizobium sp.]RWH96633.1 MAG: hypothetical protein EOQ88_19735 [Mesorhizobium sp.]
MSNLELREFHSFLERLIENSSREQRFSVDKIVNTVLSEHPQRLEKIQNQVISLGLRALIRNNCRAKTSATDNGPDMFGDYHIGKRVSVPYKDDKGKLRWDKKRRGELTFDDFDEIIARWDDRPARQSQDRRDFEDIAKRIRPYRDRARTVGEALEMAARDSL